MSATYERERIRLKIDCARKSTTGGLIDVITGAKPDCWSATDVQFELAFYFGDELLDVTNIDGVVLEAKPWGEPRGSTLFEGSAGQVDFNPNLTEEQWEAGESQHVTITFTNDQMDIDLQGKPFRDLLLIVHGTTSTGDVVVFASGKLTVNESGIGSAETPVFGSSIIPAGATYDGSGEYSLTVVEGKVYEFVPGDNDTNLENGSETLTSQSRFTADSTTVTLNGDAGTAVTARVRKDVFYTAEEVNAKLASTLKTIMPPGATIVLQSENEEWFMSVGVTNDGEPFMQPKART